MKVVIAEKPSVAKEIASFLGATKKGDGYLEGNGYQVTWAIGHLVRLADLDSYAGFEGKNWKDTQHMLPFVPNIFRLVIARDDVKNQYFTVKRLFDSASEIIAATDAGQEGELIFRYIYSLAGIKKPFKRWWISSLTNEALTKGFQNLRPGSEFDNLYYAAKARSEGDWILGINLTRLYTLKFSNDDVKVISIGRVQTPTLNLICGRFEDNKNFRKTSFFVPCLTLRYEEKQFPVKFAKQFPTAEEANEILGRVGASLQCTDKKVDQMITDPPKLFNLTHLQQFLNKRFAFSGQKTLDLLQKLYEAKLVTYPRTDSNYLPQDMRQEVEKSIQQFHYLIDDKDAIDLKNINSYPFDDAKVTDHHAIIPTNIQSKHLTGDEETVYLAVVERFLQAFAKPCIEEKTILTFQESFRAFGKAPVQLGWKNISLFQQAEETKYDESEDDDELDVIPDLQVGSDCVVVSKECHSGFTTPPAIYNDGTLLKAMEHASDQVIIPENAKKYGLGTSATRAGIIEVLIQRRFVNRHGNKLIPTDAGVTLYALTKDAKFGSIKLTVMFEEKIHDIVEGKHSYKSFISEIISLTAQSSIMLHGINEQEHRMTGAKETNHLLCPKCKQGKIVERENFFGCTDWKAGCSFKIWREYYGRRVSLAQMEAIIQRGKTSPLKFKSTKTGKNFEVPLRLNLITEKLEFVFDNQ